MENFYLSTSIFTCPGQVDSQSFPSLKPLSNKHHVLQVWCESLTMRCTFVQKYWWVARQIRVVMHNVRASYLCMSEKATWSESVRAVVQVCNHTRSHVRMSIHELHHTSQFCIHELVCTPSHHFSLNPPWPTTSTMHITTFAPPGSIGPDGKYYVFPVSPPTLLKGTDPKYFETKIVF